MTVSLDQIAPSSLQFDAADPILAHAAEELRAHLRPGVTAGVSVVLEIRPGSVEADGFENTVTPDRVTVAGSNARGVLNGVYALLEDLGYRWVRPGARGTRLIPGRALPDSVRREAPSFARRTLILGNDGLHDEWRDWMEFASRNRMNSLFFHDTPPSVLDRGGATRPATADGIAADGKGWMFERWDEDGPAIVAEAEKRGLALQFGGHHLPALLKRELFAEHPDWFPEREGQREQRYNLCPTSPGGIAEVRARARDFFRRFAGAQVYHLWADDILGGGWCSCAGCAGLTPSDQALLATNVLAEELAAVAPGAEIAHLAYHDTIAPPRTVRPAANVTALYAPRNRNYAFAIDDPACPHNREGHFSELEGLATTFRERPGALAVFEYYSDAILYKWMDPPNLAVLPADAAAYRRMGVADFGDLAVSPRPWFGPTWHAWWFARCAWNSEPNTAEELHDFCAAAYEADGPRFERLYRDLDAGYREFLDITGLERIPRHDILDFSDTPREGLRRKAGQIREAIEAMNASVADLPLRPAGLGRDAREDLSVQLAMANHLAERVEAWDAALDERMAEAGGHLDLARLHLRALNDWDHTHTPAAYANLSRGMLGAANWHTRRIEKLAGVEPPAAHAH